MTGGILAGTLLVLATWLAFGVGIAAAGLPAAWVMGREAPRVLLVRTSLWWGLGLLTVVVLALSLRIPLGSASAGWVLVLMCVASGLSSVRLLARSPLGQWPLRFSRATWLLIVGLLAMIVYLAAKALGPATNYDTGLYHLGFIRYLADYGTVTGLANLFLPFGYANAQFPLAAVLNSSPWGSDGWRLLNGLLVVLIVVDLILRLGERRRSWGTWTLAVGLGAMALPLIGMADSLIASPTSDTAVMLLTLASAAYLCDLLDEQARRGEAGRCGAAIGVIVVTTGLTIAMRPTMLAYAGGVALVLGWWLWNRRASASIGRLWVLPGVWFACLGAVQVVRDYLLSGWLLYPLSVYQWNVRWAGRDPTPLRDATLAAARDPGAADGYRVAHSWEWIGAWVQRLPTQWEPWFLLVGLLTTIGVVVWVRGGSPLRIPSSQLLLSLVPSLVAVAAWFVLSPPSFRFAWGPCVALLAITLGAALTSAASDSAVARAALVAVGVAVIGVTTFSAVVRNQADRYTSESSVRVGPVTVTYATASAPVVPTTPVTMVSGLVVQTPASGGDQCWASYPLCTFSMGDRIGLLGQTIGDGFITVP